MYNESMGPSKGLFDSFDNLDHISVEAVASWLKSPPALNSLENYLANRILYPQTLPQTSLDMQIDLAILREALKANVSERSQKVNALLDNNPFLNITLRKILIPDRFLNFVPDLTSLMWAFIDGLLLDRRKEDWFEDLWTIVLTDDNDEVAGSLLLPQFEKGAGVIRVSAGGKNYDVKKGCLMVIPCPKARIGIIYKLQNGTLLGKKENATEVYGGCLGIMIDGRSI